MSGSSGRLVVDNLACGHGERPLFSGFDLSLNGGETARIMGDNGIGKSTLLRTLAGLGAPLAGHVDWYAGPGRESEQLVESLCFVGHENALNANLSPLENLSTLTRLAGRGADNRTIRDTLADLGLKKIVHRACGRLSSGQKRRVSLARLWLTDASLWLLDEPAAALDVHARQALAERVRAHADSGGLVVYTTHESLDLADTQRLTLEPC